MGSSDLSLCFFLVAAVVLIFIQRAAFSARRTGNEKSPFETLAQREAAQPQGADDGKV